MSKKAPESLPEDFLSPGAGSTSRFPDDDILRLHGFTIHARPRNGQPVWRRGKKLLFQRDALLLVRAGVVG